MSKSVKSIQVLGEETFSVSEYPVLKKAINPDISATGAIVMDSDSNVILYSKNKNLRFSSASTAKIMTALTALDYFKPDDILTVKEATSEGSILGLSQGERISFGELIYGLLLPSANDAAFAIAQNYNSDFVRTMNINAYKFNLFNTHYNDPAGLLDDEDYTTPWDLARLSSFAMKNEDFAKIVSTKEKTIISEEGKSYNVKNLNKLLGDDGVIGIKTGTTEGAGQVLVTARKEGQHTLIIVVMGSEDRFLDTQKILDSLSGNITYSTIVPK